MKRNMTKILLLPLVALVLVACNGSDTGQNLPTESNNTQTSNESNVTGSGISSNATGNDLGIPQDILEILPDEVLESLLEGMGNGGATIFSPETGEVITGNEALEIGREHGLIPEDDD